MPAPPRAIFLSYASQDADAAKAIAAALSAAHIVVWLDQSELRSGDAWDARIQRQIDACTLFLPVISSHTQGRREGYFRFEWKLAEERMRRMAFDTPFLVPVSIDEVRKRDALVPRPFLDVQWARLGRGEEPGAEFVAHIRTLLAQGTLRGETLLHHLPPGTIAAPASADRSILLSPELAARREPTGATLLAYTSPPAPLPPRRPIPLAARDPAERRIARRFLGLQIAIAAGALMAALWFWWSASG